MVELFRRNVFRRQRKYPRVRLVCSEKDMDCTIVLEFMDFGFFLMRIGNNR